LQPCISTLVSQETRVSFSLTSSNAGTVHDIRHGDVWRFVLENRSDSPLYLAVFDMTPSWEVSNLLSSAGDNSFRVVQARCKEEIALQMEVPAWLRRLGERECEEVIKVFITSKPTSFPSLILPRISLDPENNRGSTGYHDEALSTLLASLTRSFRGRDDQEQEAWATRNFIIRTTIDDGGEIPS